MKKLKVHHVVSYTYRSHIVEGTLRIIESPTDVVKVNQGEIIVIPSDSWGLEDFLAPIIYEKAVAVIGCLGGGLSHLAILMRELRKPCLLMENAIEKLVDGAKVRIEINTQMARKHNPEEKKSSWLERFMDCLLSPHRIDQNAIVIILE